jgi:thymidylate synthase (FAD)
MKILKAAGTFEIIPSIPGTPVEEELVNQLIKIERAGRTCYQSGVDTVNLDSAKKFVRMLIKRGHESVIEHGFMTVRFLNMSRGFTHEMVRHRMASFSQESTRYVDYTKNGGEVDLENAQILRVVPPFKDENEKVDVGDGRQMSASEMLTDIEKFYKALRKAGWNPEDARQLLPHALKSEIVVSANFREWRHILKLRTEKFAHWEIRSVMVLLLDYLQKIVPGVFDDFVFAGLDKNGLKYYEQKPLE